MKTYRVSKNYIFMKMINLQHKKPNTKLLTDYINETLCVQEPDGTYIVYKHVDVISSFVNGLSKKNIKVVVV